MGDLPPSNAIDGHMSSVNCTLGLEVDGSGVSTVDADGSSPTPPSLVMGGRVVSNDEDLDVTNSSSESCGTDQWSTCQVWKPQLMCYIWDQTAQTSIDSRSPELDTSECAPRPWRNSASLLRRGQWIAPQGDTPHFASKLALWHGKLSLTLTTVILRRQVLLARPVCHDHCPHPTWLGLCTLEFGLCPSQQVSCYGFRDKQ